MEVQKNILFSTPESGSGNNNTIDPSSSGEVPIKSMAHWTKVLLDTSVVMWYLKTGLQGDEDTQKKIKFVHKLIDYLSEKNTKLSDRIKPCMFYISTITLCEIQQLNRNTVVDNEILKTFSTSDIEFIPFNKLVANKLNSKFNTLLHSKERLNKLAQKHNLLPGDMALAREWIIKDMMIIATGDHLMVDVVLTMDNKQFVEIAKNYGVPCIYTIEENFNVSSSGNHIFDIK